MCQIKTIRLIYTDLPICSANLLLFFIVSNFLIKVVWEGQASNNMEFCLVGFQLSANQEFPGVMRCAHVSFFGISVIQYLQVNLGNKSCKHGVFTRNNIIKSRC